jgi:quercetin dioxygenase-like cupin family protein
VEPHRPQVLKTDKEARVIAIELPAGEEMQEHQTHERGYLFVVGGAVEIDGNGHSHVARTGFLAVFDPNERRTVRATEDARLALVLGPWPGVGHPSERG